MILSMKKTLIIGTLFGMFIFPKTISSCADIISPREQPRYTDISRQWDPPGSNRVDNIISEGLANLPQPLLPRAKVKNHRYPMPHELLKPEIKLTGACKNVVIKEWRGTEVSKSSIKIIDDSCNRAFKEFFPFVKERGFVVKTKKLPLYVSLLPWLEGGSAYRALNDTDYRFYNREKFCDENGRPCGPNEDPLPLMGFAERGNYWIFIMNDVQLDNSTLPSFASVWSHELFHMWSYHYGVVAQHPGDYAQQVACDEKLVREFTTHLGFPDI